MGHGVNVFCCSLLALCLLQINAKVYEDNCLMQGNIMKLKLLDLLAFIVIVGVIIGIVVAIAGIDSSITNISQPAYIAIIAFVGILIILGAKILVEIYRFLKRMRNELNKRLSSARANYMVITNKKTKKLISNGNAYRSLSS